MSYYSYYQQQPQWGTSGYQVVAPPRPFFQPQPNWGGRQYFQAQIGGLSPDYYDDIRDELSSIWKSRGRNGRRWLGRRRSSTSAANRGFFDSVWRGLKDVFSRGFAREDAALWHRRVYGGQVPVDELDAAQIGAAAGYEAIRHWQMYGSTYRSPLADDRDREKEALAGLAAGEAIKLLSYSGRRRHSHTRREAAETAAATAERIYAEDYDDPYEAYESGGYRRRRRGSFLRRRSSSFYETERPVIAGATGGYVSAQQTGASYISAGTPGVQYSSGTPGVQYVQAGGTPGYVGAQQGYMSPQPTYISATTGQPVQYVQGGGAYGQPTYISGGQPVGYATTGGGLAYATTGQPAYQQQPYVTGGTQYVQPTGYSQTPYVTGQQTGYMAAPQGYSRVRSLSTGYSQAPSVIYR